MPPRPPASNAELAAYNAGRRLMRDAAEQVGPLLALRGTLTGYLRANEEWAYGRLGVETWWYWFLRGWRAAEDHEGGA